MKFRKRCKACQAFSELNSPARQGLKHRVGNKEELKRQVVDWYNERNRNMKTVDWQFRTKDARIKLKRLYPSFKF